MNTSLPFPSGRQPVLARNIVATSQPLAAQAGAAAFARGGNAIDAALAAAITLTVVEPVMNGIGGDGFALVWEGNRLHGLNASGRSPAPWDASRFKDLAIMPQRGWESVTVPGQVAGWVSLSERFGALPFEDLFVDALRHARDGFPVSPVISSQWKDAVAELHVHPGFAAFMPHGRAPTAGEIWRFADQARTLEEIARTRGESFYRGRLAEAITDFAKLHGGALSRADLDQHRSEWVEPISVDFRGHQVWEIPPNGQGIATLMALGILEHLPFEDTAANSAGRMHLEIEAMQLAFADLNAHVADPAHMRCTAAQLLDPAHLAERARGIDFGRAGSHAPSKHHSGGTIYLCTADAQGRMVSYIQSNFRGFGSGVVVPGTGISMHNRGSGFVTTAGHPNQVAGGKRPMHSIIPAFLTRDARPVMAFGVMGGNMQAQGHVQMVLRHVVEQLNPQACADAPRWRINDAATLTLEPAVPEEVAQGLRAMGHQPETQAPGNLLFGSAQLVERLPLEGGEIAYAAGSDTGATDKPSAVDRVSVRQSVGFDPGGANHRSPALHFRLQERADWTGLPSATIARETGVSLSNAGRYQLCGSPSVNQRRNPMPTSATSSRSWLAVTLLAAAVSVVTSPAQAQEKVLRAVMHADVRTIDPFWTTQTIAAIHGNMVYDTLFSSDINLDTQPQMVDTWTVSADRKVYTFKLRDGLKFHDGSPVTSRDVVASMKRWGKRDGAGKQLMGYTESLTAKDDKTFVWALNEPYGLLIDILAKMGTSMPFVMREKEAMVDPFTQITEVIGSGPFMFKRDEWVPGSKAVYVKFKGYVPRKEPASGQAGGKVVKVDRVEFLWMSDPQTAQAALVAGEIDFLENPSSDFLPILRSTPGITIATHPAMGTMGFIQLNHLHPPFNNVKARRAMYYILNNADYLNTISADKSLQTLCFSYFGCGVAMETDAGSEPYKGPKDYAMAEKLFKEAGYKGEPITILHATDHAYINPANLVMIQQLRKAKFLNLDVQAMDWGSVVARRARKEAPAQGGWNIFISGTTVLTSSNPVTHTAIGMGCEKAWFGWPCDKTFEDLRRQWTFAPDLATRKKLAVELSRRAYDQVPYVSFAQWRNPIAYRSDRLSGVQVMPSIPPMWNIEKK